MSPWGTAPPLSRAGVQIYRVALAVRMCVWPLLQPARNGGQAYLLRAASLTLLLAPALAVLHTLVGTNGVPRSLTCIVLASLISGVQTLVEGRLPVRGAADQRQAEPCRAAASRIVSSGAGALSALAHQKLASQKAFDDVVRRALTHLSDPTKLATTPLLNLTVVARGVVEQHLEDNRLNRIAVIRELLLQLLEGLRPHDNVGGLSGDASRFYNCLYYPYVRGISRRRAPTVLRQLTERRKREGGQRSELEQVLAWLVRVDEDAFYKWQRRGSDTIAMALREREEAAGGIAFALGED